MVVTPDIVSEVLQVPRVVHPNYPSYERLRTVSKDEFSTLFCETPSSWGNHQNTSCLAFAKGLRILNMVMTFVLHPLSHYNTITEPCARFLLSLIKDLSIDIPSHFILSLIDVLWIQRLVISSFFLRLSHDSFANFLSPIPSLPTSSSCVPLTPLPLSGVLHSFTRSNSSNFYRSIHLRSFIFNEWSDSWDHYGIACVHGCSPWHSQWWVVLGEHSCWSYRTTTGCYEWFHCRFLSISASL